MLMSPFRPRANIKAVSPLITIPTAATAITVDPFDGSGSISRWIASAMIAPTATSSSKALISAARIELFLSP